MSAASIEGCGEDLIHRHSPNIPSVYMNSEDAVKNEAVPLMNRKPEMSGNSLADVNTLRMREVISSSSPAVVFNIVDACYYMFKLLQWTSPEQ